MSQSVHDPTRSLRRPRDTRHGPGLFALIYPRPSVLDDVEAEMALRGQEPPADEVEEEIAAIIAGTGRLLEDQPREVVRSVVAQSMAEAVTVSRVY